MSTHYLLTDIIGDRIALTMFVRLTITCQRAWACVAPFTAANNMVTPKMSIRRHVVIKTYEEIINAMYKGVVDEGGLLSDKLEAA